MFDGAGLRGIVGHLGRPYLWHYTSIKNLPGIVGEGLIPRSRLPAGSFTDLALPTALQNRDRFAPLDCDICDDRHAIRDLVPLFIAATTPMTALKSDSHSCFLKIDLNRFLNESTHFAIADGNVASGPGTTTIYRTPEGIAELDWTLLAGPGWKRPGASQADNKERKRKRSAEVLVTPGVPPAAIVEIRTADQTDRESAQDSLSHHDSPPPCYVAEKQFFRSGR